MKNSFLRPAVGFVAIGLVVTLASAFGADESSPEARYRSDRAVCLSGHSNQDRATCLKEAGAARAVAKRHALDDGSGSYKQNALLRCKALPVADQSDCQRRIDGDGTVSGSVQEGGLIREVTTVVPADPAK